MNNYLQIWHRQQSDQLADEEYFKRVVQAFYYGYNASHLSFIRDSNGLYAAVSEKFADLIGVAAQELLDKTNFDLNCDNIRVMAEVFSEQDELVKQTCQKKRFLDINAYSDTIGVYIFRKSPVINPNTGNVLGIYCIIGEYRARSV